MFIQQVSQKHSKKEPHLALHRPKVCFIMCCHHRALLWYYGISINISFSAIGKENMLVIKKTTWEYHMTHVHTKQMEKYLILLTWALQNNIYMPKIETLTSCHLVHFQCNFIIYIFFIFTEKEENILNYSHRACNVHGFLWCTWLTNNLFACITGRVCSV